jgi:hypothetical protein
MRQETFLQISNPTIVVYIFAVIAYVCSGQQTIDSFRTGKECGCYGLIAWFAIQILLN